MPPGPAWLLVCTTAALSIVIVFAVTAKEPPLLPLAATAPARRISVPLIAITPPGPLLPFAWIKDPLWAFNCCADKVIWPPFVPLAKIWAEL